MLTQKLKIPSLSVEYRLAPEHPYPAGLEDCLKVTNYVIEHHKELAVDPNKIIIAGDSAGGKFIYIANRNTYCNSTFYKWCTSCHSL